MTTFIIRRIATIVPTLIFQQLLPGDPAMILAGEERDPTVIAHLRETMHLDEPFPVRYLYWVRGVLCGDLGESLRLQQPVRGLIADKLPVTLELACIAIVIALTIGIPAGVVSNARIAGCSSPSSGRALCTLPRWIPLGSLPRSGTTIRRISGSAS